MKIAGLIARVMVRLAALPGLSFLQTYVTSARGMTVRFGQRKGDYEAYIAAGQNAYGEVRDGVGGEGEGGAASAGPSGAADGAEYDPDDYYEYDEYEDDLNDAGRPAEPSGGDYPVSDEHHSYFDDDYRSS